MEDQTLPPEKKFPLSIKLLEGPGHLPIHSQIKNALSYAIGGGLLPPGTQVASVRELAAELKLATNTVARAYQELQEEGLLVTYPGRGTFVSDTLIAEEQPANTRDATLLAILQPGIESARSIGYSTDEIRAAINNLLSNVITVGLIGISRPVVDKWRTVLEQEFGELNIEVVPLTIADLQQNEAASLAALKDVKHVFTLVTTYAFTRELLRPHQKKVSALITELSMATHQQLAELPSNQPVGLVCIDQYENSMLGLISPYVDVDLVRRVAPDDTPALKWLLAEVSLIIHTSASKPAITALEPRNVRMIELEFVPNRECFRQLYTLLKHEREMKGVL